MAHAKSPDSPLDSWAGEGSQQKISPTHTDQRYRTFYREGDGLFSNAFTTESFDFIEAMSSSLAMSSARILCIIVTPMGFQSNASSGFLFL